MSAPPRVFLDERVAASLPETPADAQESIGQDVNVIAYVREDVHLEAVRSVQVQADEIIVTISQAHGMLFGLSNLGRLFAFRQSTDQSELDIVPEGTEAWHLVAERELST